MTNACQRDWEGYDSSFEDDIDESSNKDNISHSNKTSKKETQNVVASSLAKTQSLTIKLPETSTRHSSGLPSKGVIDDVARRTESYKNSFLALNAYERHKKLVQDYLLYFPQATKLLHRDITKDKTDIDVIRENHRFLWKSEGEADTWEKQLAKKYYDKLYREYAICDLVHWKKNKVGVRWRTSSEVERGKGQFLCAHKGCDIEEDLKTWEINFSYTEELEKKNALVKLRLCPPCSLKLNCHQKRRDVTKKPKKRKIQDTKKDMKRRKLSNDEVTETTEPSASSEVADSNIWKEPVIAPESKSREEEYDEYLDDLLL